MIVIKGWGRGWGCVGVGDGDGDGDGDEDGGFYLRSASLLAFSKFNDISSLPNTLVTTHVPDSV